MRKEIIGITDRDLVEIQIRCDATTPRPWTLFVEGRDQDFIAHSKHDVPNLIKEVRRPRGLLKNSK